MTKVLIVLKDQETKKCFEKGKRRLAARLDEDIGNDGFLRHMMQGFPDLFTDPRPPGPRRLA